MLLQQVQTPSNGAQIQMKFPLKGFLGQREDGLIGLDGFQHQSVQDDEPGVEIGDLLCCIPKNPQRSSHDLEFFLIGQLWRGVTHDIKWNECEQSMSSEAGPEHEEPLQDHPNP